MRPCWLTADPRSKDERRGTGRGHEKTEAGAGATDVATRQGTPTATIARRDRTHGGSACWPWSVWALRLQGCGRASCRCFRPQACAKCSGSPRHQRDTHRWPGCGSVSGGPGGQAAHLICQGSPVGASGPTEGTTLGRQAAAEAGDPKRLGPGGQRNAPRAPCTPLSVPRSEGARRCWHGRWLYGGADGHLSL